MNTALTRFIKENHFIVAGVLLPLILIALFLVAERAAMIGVTPPQYSALVVTNYHPRSAGYPWRVNADEKGVSITYNDKDEKEENNYWREDYNLPRLYLIDHTTLTAREINGDAEISALNEAHNFIPGETSPDGYRIESASSHHHSGLFGELFGGRSYRNGPAYVSGSAAISVDFPENGYYAGDAQFLAWIKHDQPE